jgi:drug/metabolite transporter (DMT)-like permease
VCPAAAAVLMNRSRSQRFLNVNSAYFFVAATVSLTVYGQLIIKWQTQSAGAFPSGASKRLSYLVHMLSSPWVISAFAAAGIAALCWIVALSHLDLSRAYPFVSASFVAVLVLCAILFDEPLTSLKVGGALLIVSGLIVGSL